MKLRKLRKLFFSVVAFTIILLATLSTLMETEHGSRWAVAGLAKSVGVNHGAISGNLRSGLDLEFIDYRNSEQHFRAEAVSFRWRPGALLYKTLAIKSLSAKNILIQLPPAPAKKNTEPFSRWPTLHLPLQIQLEQVQLANIQYVQGVTRLTWRQLSGALTWGGTELHYKDLALLHENYQLHLTGETGLEFPYVTDAFLQWQWAAAAREAAPAPLLYRGVTALEGSLQDLQLRNEINSPVLLTADATLQLVDKKNQLQTVPSMTLALAWQQQTLPAQWWIPGQSVPRTSGKLTATGTWKKYKAQLVGDLHVPARPGLAVTAAAAGDLENIQIDLLHLRTLREIPAAPITGAANTRDEFLLANVVATTIANTLGKIIVNDSEAIADTDSGLRLNGNVRWLPHVQWQINAVAQHLDLGSLFEDWPSNLNANFSTQGEFKNKTWTAELQDLQVTGSVRDINVSSNGSMKFDGANVSSEALHIIFGANQLRLNGSMGERFNLDWDLSAPILQQIDQQINGSVQSKGKLRGSRTQPQLTATATAEQFSWKNYGVDKLDLSLTPQNALSLDAAANVNPDALRNEKYNVAFVAKQLRVAANRFSTIEVNGSGSINNHELQGLVRSSAYGRADLKVKGKFDGREWQGKFGQLAIKLKKVPRWWLTSSETIRVSADAIQVGNQCLTTRSNLTAAVERSDTVEREELSGDWLPNQSPAKNQNAWLVNKPALPANSVEKYSLPQLCLRADWTPANGLHAKAHVDSIPLRQFLSLFKTEVYFAGVMDGNLDFFSKNFALADMQVKANISTRNAELRYQYAGGTTEVYAWENFFVRATLEQAKLDVVANMGWVGYGHIGANANLDLAQKKILEGKLQAQFANLAPLETLLPFANDVKGDLRVDLSMGGPFAQPYVLGDISLHNGAANLPRLGLDLTNIELQINSTVAGDINMVSQVQSDKGKLSLVGDLSKFGTPEWSLQSRLNGSNFEIIAVPQLKATLSPDITLTANRETVHLTGAAVIPWARANIKRLPPSATQVSSDVVIIDEDKAQEEMGLPVKVFTNLDLSLGDDVQFKGFGLDSKLSGKLSLIKESQRQFFTSGYVSVVDGSYKAYGQELKIERGRLVFQGPYENPGLDIRASRIIKGSEDIQVGLEIGGTLQRPVANVYSVPSDYSESQAMMMLLTGKPSDEVTKADASVLLGAMSGLGMDSDGSVAADITKMFRLDELEIKSDEGVDQSQLFIGKYLTPKLLVRYMVGIFDRAFSFGVQYQLTDHFRLEAESGETQSVDVIYKIER